MIRCLRSFLVLAAAGFFLTVSDCRAADVGKLELSSLSFSALSCSTSAGSDTLVLTVAGRKAAALEPVIDAEGACRKGLEYFFTALALPDECFWVNLSPSSPEKVVDRELESTDFGRILLAADLKLKKDACELTNPQTKTGRENWDRLYRKAEELGIPGKIPMLNRIWIYPAPVAVTEQKERVNVVESALEVRLERGVPPAQGQDENVRQLQAYGIGLMEEIVLPALTQRVNEGPGYADLREVYRALVLARWYKSRLHARDSFLTNVFAGFRRDIEQDFFYGTREVYRDYLESMKKGEYALTESTAGRIDVYLRMMTRKYYSGGIDLRTTVFVPGAARAGSTEGSFSFTTSIAREDSRPLRTAKQRMEIRRGIGDYMMTKISELLKSFPLPTAKHQEQTEENRNTQNNIYDKSL